MSYRRFRLPESSSTPADERTDWLALARHRMARLDMKTCEQAADEIALAAYGLPPPKLASTIVTGVASHRAALRDRRPALSDGEMDEIMDRMRRAVIRRMEQFHAVPMASGPH